MRVCELEADDLDSENEPGGMPANVAFTWEGMQNYVSNLEQFIGNSGPINEAVTVNEGVKILKLFFTPELVQLIVRETNLYAEQQIKKKCLPLPRRSRVWEWKPTTEDEIYVVLALFMLMGTVQKPTLCSYFSKNATLATPIFGSVISLDRSEAICRYLHFTNNDNLITYNGPQKLFN